MEPRFTNTHIIRTPRYYEQFFLPRTVTSPPVLVQCQLIMFTEVPLQFNIKLNEFNSIELNEFNSCLSLLSPINS